MKVLIVEPQKMPYEKEIVGDLKSLQTEVGGYIQALAPFEDPELILICNDEGKLLQLPYNRLLFDENDFVYDIIAGTFLLCRAPLGSEDFEGLTDKQIKFGKERFRRIELFSIGTT